MPNLSSNSAEQQVYNISPQKSQVFVGGRKWGYTASFTSANIVSHVSDLMANFSSSDFSKLSSTVRSLGLLAVKL